MLLSPGESAVWPASPEARGRSERMFATLQDRLIKELALADISQIEAANRFIREVYLPRHNARFARPAALAETAFVAADLSLLAETLCIEEERIVARDNTVVFGARRLSASRLPGAGPLRQGTRQSAPVPRRQPGCVPRAKEARSLPRRRRSPLASVQGRSVIRFEARPTLWICGQLLRA